MAYQTTRAITDAVVISPSDDYANGTIYWGFYVGSAGNVAVMPLDQVSGNATPTPVTFHNCAAGYTLKDFAFVTIMNTNTTAGNIVCFGPRV